MSNPQRSRPHATPIQLRLLSFGAALTAAALAWFFAPGWIAGTTRAVATYDAAALVLLIMLWAYGMHSDPEITKSRAAMQDPGRNLVMGLVLTSVAIGFSSAVAILGHGSHAPTANERTVANCIAVIGAAAGWLLINTLFTFRYAHMYYFDQNEDQRSDRGLTFPGSVNPNDQDFAYFAFVIGMTFQVSDVQITDSRFRQVILTHGLISFVYNTLIVAFGINILAGLIQH